IVSWVASGELVGAELLIVKDGRAAFHEAYGWSDREEMRPVERSSIWSIKSMSKPFTATAILMLADDGDLSLDDPVSRYVPGFAGHDGTSIRHLLSHTSGYREEIGDPRPEHESLGDWVQDGASKEPTGALGEFHYSDFNYGALGFIVEIVSGTSIDAFTETRIVRKLGLRDTSTGFSSDPAWRARLNPWYRWNERGGSFDLRWTSDWKGWPFYTAAWGMFSTAMDYAVFMSMWMNEGEWNGERLLSELAVDEALRPHGRIGESYAYGHGWYLDDVEGLDRRPFGHGGGDGTESWAIPADDAIVIFLTHSRWGPWHSAFWNRVGMSGLFEHYPGLGMDWATMQWATEAGVSEIDLSPKQRA
ncbi:MAG: serine hydrolase domain-containing protein, partial [Halobacteriales archaeon]|nr:serine hydrolase domain-containing protein [Halobacteriales archaeon]